MTRKQYERLGMVFEKMAILNSVMDSIYHTKSELCDDLSRFMEQDRASKFVSSTYGQLFAGMHSLNELADFIVQTNRKEKEK